ncbi:hypothetical protein [Glutamicibacter arilaitensis]|uniref:hypothetical protein n=1 Tax=Glutamicibacter arilaitensis TaxID=256701 RepID=UPI0038509CD1
MDAIFLVLIIAITGLFVLGYWQSSLAKKEHETVVGLSRARATEIVESSFGGLLWADVHGLGDINKKRRSFNDSGATISVKISTTDDGKTHVVAWMSEWKARYGMVASSGWPLAKRVIKKLEEA